jgi:hypothetical protein
MKYQDLWPLIQKDILGLIQADDFLGTRPGVLIEPGDVDSVIQMKINRAIGPGLDGKSGVGFLVLPIERADDDNANMPGGPLKLTIIVEWCENVLINNSQVGTGYPIRAYAAACEKLMKLYTPVGLTQNLVPARPTISEFSDPTASTPTRIGRVEFTAMEADFKPFVRVNRPQISVTGGVIAGQAFSYQLPLELIRSFTPRTARILTKATPPPNLIPRQSRLSGLVFSAPALSRAAAPAATRRLSTFSPHKPLTHCLYVSPTLKFKSYPWPPGLQRNQPVFQGRYHH